MTVPSSEKPKVRSRLRRWRRNIIVYLGGPLFVIAPLAAIADGGEKIFKFANNGFSFISSFFQKPECSGEMTWEQRKNCDP